MKTHFIIAAAAAAAAVASPAAAATPAAAAPAAAAAEAAAAEAAAAADSRSVVSCHTLQSFTRFEVSCVEYESAAVPTDGSGGCSAADCGGG